MFGKKKDEEWEYIGDYYQNQSSYDGIDPKTAEFKAKTDTDYLNDLFKPFLKQDEQILCVIGGGKGDARNPLENEKAKKAGKKVKMISSVLSALFVLGSVLLIFGKGKLAFTGLLAVLPFMLCSSVIPIILLAAVIAIIIWALSSGNKGVNYAITDRRLISYGYGNYNEISLKDIVSTNAHVGRGTTGSITLKATRYNGAPAFMTMIIPKVNEPLRVKYILDNAIEKYKAGGMDYKKESSDGSQPEYVPQTPKKLHKDDVPLTMYDKKIRTPYNLRSSDDIND